MSEPATYVTGSWSNLPLAVQRYCLRWTSIFDCAAVGMTSRDGYTAFKTVAMDRQEGCIKGFDLPLSPTLDMMRIEGAILSGSAVLDVLHPGCLTPGDLDIYIPRGGMPAIHAFLESWTDYLLLKSLRPSGDEHRNVYGPTNDTALAIRRISYYVLKASGSVLNVIETTSTTPTTAVFMFHSTFVMNYMTWDAIICAYPKFTSTQRGLANRWRQRESAAIRWCRRKYWMRGFVATTSAERKVDEPATMRISLTLQINATPDVIDPQLTWRLACRHDPCYSKVYRPSSGWVLGGNGDYIERTAASIST
ncbi:hypothetical protein D9611_014436 [Ephemerocybe angulata]|uniref:Uncharacterized protein n=1 Tax=Ephemerocybe angulata TaxID=980116 RepID=A0A8H5ARS2_9AGAR|nr:hypothetical protein D9611_014436 [Tulosesus angulatus]